MVNVSDFATCIYLNNQPFKTRPTLINLNPDEYNPGLHYYPSTANLGRCNGLYNTLDDPYDKIWVPNTTEDANFTLKTTVGSN